MENQTEFDLNHAIQNWRQHFSQSPSYRAENLNELESHLRDSVATLAGTGLSEDEAFLVAARRIGGPQALEPEFAKVNGKEVWMNRLLWMLVGVQAWAVISTVSDGFSRTGSQLLCGLMMPPSSLSLGAFGQALCGRAVPAIPAVLFILADFVALVALASGCWWLVRRSENRLSLLVRQPGWLLSAVVVLCLVLFLVAALKELGSAFMARMVGPSTYGEIVMSMTVAGMVLFVLKTVTLATVTVLLARRQIQRAAA